MLGGAKRDESSLAHTDARIMYCAGGSASAKFMQCSREDRVSRSDRVIRGYFSEASPRLRVGSSCVLRDDTA